MTQHNNLYLSFFLITLYMVVTYHIIALKYRKSRYFLYHSKISRIFLVSLHVFIVITNIFFYFWLIARDFNPVYVFVSVIGLLLFAAGLSIIFWGGYSLRKAVFVPGNNLKISGPFAHVRHPMYLGGIVGAFGLALFAGSLHAFIYSIILAAVLSHIADAEEEELKERFGQQYTEYTKAVPKLFPHFTYF